MFLDKLLSVIGHFFAGLFNAAKKAYKNLTPEQQAALLNGSGLVEIINSMLDKTPAEVRAAIQQKFPNLPEPLIEAALFKVVHAFNLIPTTNSLEDVIAAVQKKLTELDGKEWATVSHGMAVVISVFLAPPETKVAAIVSLIEFVFQHFIKKS